MKMVVRIRFIKKMGINNEGTEKTVDNRFAQELYKMGVIMFPDKEGLETAFPGAKMLLKYGLSPFKINYTRTQVLECLTLIEAGIIKY